MEIKVLGSGCPNCKKLHQAVVDALAEKNLEADVQKVEDIAEIIKAGVMMTPGLVINGKVVSTGKVLTSRQVGDLIEKAK
jgi:small redox-active disulfide protein 2